ncbi:hypothetical protein MMAD_14650 [Mycolicibacterium madagascariense]|uniref:Uncharacterized protein n=1 Tax=Mycolicibacterium madagascariense TaxID=212765 RepID=A0A7I7XD14_9MYCO|nr:hypothetical protein [Mycolicibacterium madagascariense]MCV7015752.1 hypothetical protein [Mycolicibacterium madagascariense]BBZ27170.1 hypothetical protein MMAD_14650 [Mycolicibacterium madagascariense]
MIHYGLIFLSGAVSSLVAALVVRRWRTRWAALVVNAVTSFLLGGFAAAGGLFSPTQTTLGYAALGTATSLAFLAGNGSTWRPDGSSPVLLASRVLRLVAVHAVVCTAFAMAGYLIADAAYILIVKLT